MALAHSMEQQRSTKPHLVSQVPITSSWCKRALRPLTAIIVRLEKHWKATPLDEKQENAAIVPEGAVNVKPTRSRRESQQWPYCVSDSESSPDDPTWVPGGVGQKRIKHRYSGHKQAGGAGRPRVVPRSPETEKLRPGEFTISTPLVLGKRRKVHDGDDDETGNVCQAGKPCPGEQFARNYCKRKSWPPTCAPDMPQRDSSDQYNDPGYVTIIHGILGVWNTFLRMTADEHVLSSGARSLTMMALNKTSEYILHEQEHQNSLEDKDEEVDVADFIITELERTYALSDRGWKPLKGLVRAHGIRLVCEAVRRKWIPPRLCRQLILIAEKVSSFDAAESLLSVLLSSTPNMPPPGRLDSSLFSAESRIGINTLHTYANKSGRRGVLFRDLASLVSCRALPVEWMATEDARTFLADAIQSISSDNGWAAHSAQFIVNVLCAATGTKPFSDRRSDFAACLRRPQKDRSRFSQPRPETKQRLTTSVLPDEPTSHYDDFISTALSNTVSSIITILTAAHFALCNRDLSTVGDSDSPMHRVISLASTIVQREIELNPPAESGGHFRIRLLRMGQVLLADFMLRSMGRKYDKYDTAVKSPAATTEVEEVSSPPMVVGSLFLGNFEYFLGLISNRGALVSELSQLILQISRCCGRVQGGDGFSQVKRLTEALSSHTSTKATGTNDFPVLRAVLNKVALDVALSFAELTCLREHHAWALDVQETVSATGVEVELERFDGLSGPGTPSLALSATGFRWEDGIGEWVARSPVVARQNKARGGTGHAGTFRPYSPSSSGETSAASGDGSDSEETSSTLPSSVGAEEDAETRWNVEEDRNVSGTESSSLSGVKRKSLPGGVFPASSDNKRRKQTPSSSPSSLRYGLRRRRTTSGCGFYVDGGGNHDESGDASAPESLGPTRRDRRVRGIGANNAGRYLNDTEAKMSSRCTNGRRGRPPRPRPGCSGVEVEVRIPATSPSTETKMQSGTTDLEVVVPQNDRHKYYSYSLQETNGDMGSAGCSDDDIFVSAPVLRDRIGFGKRRRGRPPTKSPPSTYHASCKVSPVHTKRVGMSRSLRPRRPRAQVRDEVFCAESSEDELSFM